MSTITLPALYRSETFGTRSGQNAPVNEAVSAPIPGIRPHAAPQKQAPFLAQLIVGNDADFNRKLGRADIARAREAAYSGMQAMAGRDIAAGGQLRRPIADRIA